MLRLMPISCQQRMTGQIPHGYFTLVNRFGQTMVGGVPLNTTLQRDITKPISNALGLTYKMQDLVTYEGGSYSPMPDAKKVGKEWVYLNVTGLVPECTPCYAWIAKGGEHLLLDLSFLALLIYGFPAKVTSRDGRPEKQGVSKIYVGLSKPGSSAGEWTRIVVFDPKERKCVPARPRT
ncbi:hypothetical protein BDP27DRAFT_258930 [Rhodocollybia butyracea]|uniref:Uncharacterized protein n=1 Tax=Rhodocollybia butyracea TaxID=206335 RepID=A0A9P5U2S1_9AGAR|nr:hypothetical protein BDP27DRAFT_258930 [Rhodocollybia butyracea]